MLKRNGRKRTCNLELGRAVSACLRWSCSMIRGSLLVRDSTRWASLEEGVEIAHLDGFEHDTSRSWQKGGRLLRNFALLFLASSRNAASSFSAFACPFHRVSQRDSHLSCSRAIVRKYASIEGSTIVSSLFQSHSYRFQLGVMDPFNLDWETLGLAAEGGGRCTCLWNESNEQPATWKCFTICLYALTQFGTWRD